MDNLFFFGLYLHMEEEPNWQNPQPHLDTSPKSEPAQEQQSRAVPSVEAHHHVNGPDTGKNTGGRWISGEGQ